jgi:hypothetical protein
MWLKGWHCQWIMRRTQGASALRAGVGVAQPLDLYAKFGAFYAKA